MPRIRATLIAFVDLYDGGSGLKATSVRVVWVILLGTLYVMRSLAQDVSVGSPPTATTRSEYNLFVREYQEKPLIANEGLIRSEGVGTTALLTINVIEGDDLPVEKKTVTVFGPAYRIVRYGCSVSTGGRVSFFRHGFGGIQGGGYPTLSHRELSELRSLAANLPSDHSRLPPPGRRLVIQASVADETIVRVYDRANLPDEVFDLLSLAKMQIQPWSLRFNPEKIWNLSEFFASGIQLPNEPLAKTYSPDGSWAVIQGSYEVLILNTKTSLIEHELRDEVGLHTYRLSHPYFTPDGHHLLLQNDMPALRIYETKTWQQVNTLPGLPENVEAYFASPDWSRGVFQSSASEIGLWDWGSRNEVTQLAEHENLLNVSFSPDNSLIATASQSVDNDSSGKLHVRIWSAEDGRLVKELQPSAQVAGGTGKFLWWPGSEYLLTPIDHSIAIWNVHSGRHLAELSACVAGIDRYTVSSEGSGVFAHCNNDFFLTWDVGKIIEKVKEVEKSLETTN